MKKLLFPLYILLSIISCSTEQEIIDKNNEGLDILEFKLLAHLNPSIPNDITLIIDGTNIYGNLPAEANETELIATFTHNSKEVFIDQEIQTSNTSKVDFTNIVKYRVVNNDGSFLNYSVDITKFTGLPVTYINTNNLEINSTEEYLQGKVSIDGGRLSPDFTQSEIEIRGRGNSTWYFHDKKPYQLKLKEKLEFLGMPKDKKWIFLAEHSDKTLMRNKIAFEMGYLSSLEWTPKSTYSEVFLNGKYNGTYHISQKVEESNRRVALGDTGYLLEIDQLERIDIDDVYFRTNNYRNTHNQEYFLFNIKEPKLNFNDAEFNYIKNLIDAFEKTLKSNLFAHPTLGYSKHIDIDSFIDYYLINEISKNQDAKDFSSIYLNVIPGSKIKMGPLWDFDLAFGNVNYSDCEFPTGFWIKENTWFKRLFEDPVFVSKVKNRFAYYRSQQDYLLNKIDYYASLLQFAQKENDLKWNVIGVYQWPNPVVLDTYHEEVGRLKSWLTQRMDWLDTEINKL
jgi:hypothetical protein